MSTKFWEFPIACLFRTVTLVNSCLKTNTNSLSIYTPAPLSQSALHLTTNQNKTNAQSFENVTVCPFDVLRHHLPFVTYKVISSHLHSDIAAGENTSIIINEPPLVMPCLFTRFLEGKGFQNEVWISVASNLPKANIGASLAFAHLEEQTVYACDLNRKRHWGEAWNLRSCSNTPHCFWQPFKKDSKLNNSVTSVKTTLN